MSYGLVIYDEGDPDNRKLKYDTRLRRLQVQLNEGDNRLKIFERSGGTALTSSGSLVSETLLRVPHNLPFKPKFSCYFYCRDAPAAQAALITGYQGTAFYMPGTNIFTLDQIFAETDTEYFYIKHSILASADTSKAPEYEFRIKYLIYDTPDISSLT